MPSAPTSPPRSSPPSAARSRPPRTRSPQLAAAAAGTLRVRQAASFGALWTVAQVAEQLGIKQALGVTRAAELSYWQVLARVRRPGASLLALVRLAASGAAAGWLGWCRAFTEDDLYANGTWLEGRHAIIERRLWQARPAALKDQLFRYDVTSSYLEGEENALANWGYNRDRTEGKPPVVVGLLTDSQGEPLAIRVFPGNTSDPKTFGPPVRKLQQAFGGAGVTLVGDRGMIRSEQKAAAQAAGFPFSTALTQPQIQKLRADKVFPRELFAEDICAVSGDDGRRYVLRRNPGRPVERQRTRAEKQAALLAAWAKANTYLAAHPRAKVATQPRYLSERIQRLQAPGWRQLMLDQRRLARINHKPL